MQYVIFISVLISLLVSAFISLTYLQSHFKDKVTMYKIAIQNADLGMAYTFENEITYNKKTIINVDNNIISTIKIIKSHWGVFDLIKVNSLVKNDSFQKMALIGGYNNQRSTLYLQDNNRPLVVVGNTSINGNVTLPRSGVKRGNISGHSYNGTQLIYGEISKSKNQLPPIKNINHLKNIHTYLNYKDSLEYIEIYEDQNLIHSFSKTTKIYKENDVIDLNYLQLRGNIIIQSDTLIHVRKSAFLHDVILIAPKIEIDAFVQGNFQAFATQKITVGSYSKLSYPTALILINENYEKKNADSDTNQIQIHAGAEIKGLICYESIDLKKGYQAQIVIEENARVIGEVYCNQNTELKGIVDGTIYTNGFIAKANGSVYQNHIYNGQINGEKLPKQYGGFLFEGIQKQVVQWVY